MNLTNLISRRDFVAGAVLSPLLLQAKKRGSKEAPMQFAMVGDAGVSNTYTKKIRESIVNRGVKDVCLLGDNLYFYDTDTYHKLWDPWRLAGLNFSVTAIGNHGLGDEEEMAYFQMPGEFYQRRFGDTEFFVLNSNNEESVALQFDFLNVSFRQSNARFKFIIAHHPFVTISDRHSWTERPRFQKAFRDFILKNEKDITVIFSGHDHNASLIQVNSLPLVISGASWELFAGKTINYQDQAFHVRSRWTYRSHPHWVRLEIFSELGEVWLHYIDAQLDKTAYSIQIKGNRAG